MRWQGMLHFGLGIGAALVSTCTLAAQTLPSSLPASTTQSVVAPAPVEPSPSATAVPVPVAQASPKPAPEPPGLGAPMGAESPGGAPNCGCKERCDGWGPTLPENVKLFGTLLPDCKGNGIQIYGWADVGYTYSSTGSGLLAVQPRENRFGNEFTVNQLAVVIEKKLRQDDTFNWGFNATFYAGSDAAELLPRGGFTTTNPRFGVDFRQLYLSAHLPILTEGGMDVQAGRMGTIIGYNSAMAPYRPFYSSDYQWFYAQDGAWTGFLTNLHVNKQLDVLNGMTLGANTFFTYRGNAPCYIGQINYWLTEAKQTLLSSSLHIGNQAIFAAGPQFIGDSDYVVEMRVQHNWNKCLTQIIQSDLAFASGVPGIGTTEFYSLYSIWSFHATEKVDANFRAEWCRDVQGSRIGTAGNFSEVTFGFDYHPTKFLRLRPEIRGDFADRPAFNNNNRSQLTLGIDALLSF
jgi:hypothetical protein